MELSEEEDGTSEALILSRCVGVDAEAVAEDDA